MKRSSIIFFFSSFQEVEITAAETKPSVSAAPRPRKLPATWRGKRAGAAARSRRGAAGEAPAPPGSPRLPPAGLPAARHRARRHPRTLPGFQGEAFSEQPGLLYCKAFSNPQTCYKTAPPGCFPWGGAHRTQHGGGSKPPAGKRTGGHTHTDFRVLSQP